MHNALSITTIRFCGASGKPVICRSNEAPQRTHFDVKIANFDDCVWATTNLTPNVNLEQLGVVMLECMNGLPNKDLRNPAEIRHQRKSNKMFSLQEGERWSGYKLLADFLDNMFNKDISAIAKLDKPVSAHSFELEQC